MQGTNPPRTGAKVELPFRPQGVDVRLNSERKTAVTQQMISALSVDRMRIVIILHPSMPTHLETGKIIIKLRICSELSICEHGLI